MIRRLVLGLLFAAATSFSGGFQPFGIANAAQALLNTEVAPAKWKAVRLKNLPKGAAVGARYADMSTVNR